jgi:hypothetical protein
MITNIINPILIFIQTLLFPFRNIIIIFGVGYSIYWYIRFILSSEEKEISFKNDPFKKTVIHWAIGSYFIGFGFALIYQDFDTKYIYLTFPFYSLILPIGILVGFAIQSIAYETWKSGKGSKE